MRHPEQQYQSLFLQFNQRFFGGRLPRYTVVLHPQYREQGVPLAGACHKRARRIDLTAVPLPAGEGLLLHEMVHAAIRSQWHGPQFRYELQRVYDLGAPVMMADQHAYLVAK